MESEFAVAQLSKTAKDEAASSRDSPGKQQDQRCGPTPIARFAAPHPQPFVIPTGERSEAGGICFLPTGEAPPCPRHSTHAAWGIPQTASAPVLESPSEFHFSAITEQAAERLRSRQALRAARLQRLRKNYERRRLVCIDSRNSWITRQREVTTQK